MALDRLFHPRSIAVVGASLSLGEGKLPFYQILRMAGFKGPLYAVNPAHKELLGEKVYPSLEAVPETVDLAICTIPARHALGTVEVAARRQIPFIHFFTSGFSEQGDRQLEQDLIRAARQGPTRIVGPNCLGVHCTASRVSFDPTILDEQPGPFALLSQSGGVANNCTRLARARRVGLNKAVSYGNQIDLRVEDFLEYFADDDGIRAIGAYIEDIKDGRAFLRALGRVTPAKPVIVLKGGATEEGAAAAASHTGALAGSQPVWSGLMRQHRCIEVETQEQLVDALLLATSEKLPRGNRLGFLAAGGGTSVLFTDCAVKAGLAIPELAAETQEKIAARIPQVNTSTRNPVDLGAFGFDHRIMSLGMRALDLDPNIDVIVIYLCLDFLQMFREEALEAGFRAMAAEGASRARPVVVVISRWMEDDPRIEQMRLRALSAFRDAGLPLYANIQDAVHALRAILRWTARPPHRVSR
ncbi:MAG: CoA-binding protein [bacterium]